MSTEKYKGRKYTIQNYDPNWVKRYNFEADNIREVIGDKILYVEHIGSTAVPGLGGKSTIDILITVKTIETADGFTIILKQQGYNFLGQYVMEGSRLYTKEKDGERLVNLHFFHKGHKHINEMLHLRNYLRSHPETVNEYSQLKFDLVERYPDDYGSYRKYKDAWMNKLKNKL